MPRKERKDFPDCGGGEGMSELTEGVWELMNEIGGRLCCVYVMGWALYMYTEEPHYERGQGKLVRSSCGPIGQLAISVSRLQICKAP